MGQPRSKLHDLLKAITDNVYFQPPENTAIKYPCIIYNREDSEFKHANNQLYDQYKRYTVMVIDKDPDSELPDEVAKLPMCTYNRFYTADGLNHDVYQVFF